MDPRMDFKIEFKRAADFVIISFRIIQDRIK